MRPFAESKEDRDEKVVFVGRVAAEVKPETVRPITELLKTPSTRSVFEDIEEQLPTKLRKLLQASVPTVK